MWSTQFPDIIQFLKRVSGYFKQSSKEFIIHCPYCDDATRKNAHSHGHLYISIERPVFHCFRCDSSGVLINLIKDLGYNDESVINRLSSSVKFNVEKNSTVKLNRSKSINFYERLLNMKFCNPGLFDEGVRYIQSRIDRYVDLNYYRMIPEMINNQTCISFYNYDNNFTTARIITPKKNYRYIKNNGSMDLYYFQEKDFDQYDNIVLAEGPFDIVSLHRYSVFPKDKSFYLALLSKNYGKVLTRLIQSELMIGRYNVHLVFDSDNSYYMYVLKVCQKIANRFNQLITVNGYRPVISNDVGEMPLIRMV